MSTEAPTLPAPTRTKVAVRDLSHLYGRAAQGSTDENELVQQNLVLVKQVVGRLAMSMPSHVDQDDLYSSGLVGLLNAVRNFDPKGGSTFESYARVRIRGAIFDELRKMDWVPRSVHDKARKVQAVMQELEQKNGRPANEDEVAKALNLSMDEYHELLEEIRPATFVCLDASPVNEDDDESRHDRIADDSQTNPLDDTVKREVSGIIAERIKQLPDMQRKVLALYYFEDLRLREIAEAFGVTESRICQVHSQAILAIRSFLKQKDDADEKTLKTLKAK
jgi:RNA polymerase sigma factor for flagellar operon FliA